MKWDLNKVLKNPDIAVAQSFGGGDGAPAAKALAKAQREVSPLAARFEQVWAALGGPELVQEYAFHPERQWRADYCHEATKTLIELEGGTWSGGRHTRGQGYRKDCEKYNAALVLRYSVFRLATGMVTVDNVQMIIDHVTQAK